MGYAEVKRIYNGERTGVFVMATSYLMGIGFQNALKITNTEIEEVEGNGLMTKEFCQELIKIAREIATNCTPSEFIQLCQVVEPFAMPEKLPRERMEKIINGFIGSDPRSLELMVVDGSFEPEDLQGLGFWTEQDVEQYYEKYETKEDEE